MIVLSFWKLLKFSFIKFYLKFVDSNLRFYYEDTYKFEPLFLLKYELESH